MKIEIEMSKEEAHRFFTYGAQSVFKSDKIKVINIDWNDYRSADRIVAVTLTDVVNKPIENVSDSSMDPAEIGL